MPKIGDLIADKYRIEGTLGSGGMGLVLEARHLELGHVVAVKVLNATEDDHTDAHARFLQEARAAAALTSDHIVRIHDVGRLPTGAPFMVMERLRGKDVATLLTAKGTLSLEDAAEIISQAAEGLAEAHDRGIVHRDIKPSNLFLLDRGDGQPWVKVLDFGISKQLDFQPYSSFGPGLTGTRQLMGSPAYMAPEQIRDSRNVDARTDIWALGATLYELLAGRAAFVADNFPSLCIAIATDHPTPLGTLRPDLPSEFLDVVSQCLAKTPDQRLRSARNLVALLEPYRLPYRSSGSLCLSEPAPMIAKTARVRVAEATLNSTAELGPEISSSRRSPSRKALSVPNPRITLDGAPESRGQRVSVGRIALEKAASRTPSQRLRLRDGGPQSEDSFRTLEVQSPPTRRPTLTMPPRTRRLALWLSPGGLVFGLVGALLAIEARSERDAPTGPATESVATSNEQGFQLILDSIPGAAEVYEANQWLGVTPLQLMIAHGTVSAAPRTFVLKRAGFAPYSVVQAASTQSVRVIASLTRDAGSPATVTGGAAAATHGVRRELARAPAATATAVTSEIRGSR